jgi:hypothetical protein
MENPAATNFAQQYAKNMQWGEEIAGESKNAKIDREMQERYRHHWPAGGDKAMYGTVDDTLAGKINDGRFPPIV